MFMNNKLFTWLEQTGGMQIPLKRMPDFIKDERGLFK